MMAFRQPEKKVDEAVRQRLIRAHAGWLNRAVRQADQYPRIPVRPVSEGGFARLMARREGRSIAAWWWESALEQAV